MSQPIQEGNKALVLEAFDTLFNTRDDAPVPGGSPSFATLAAAAQGSTFLDVHDSLGVTHTVTTYEVPAASSRPELSRFGPACRRRVIQGGFGRSHRCGQRSARVIR